MPAGKKYGGRVKGTPNRATVAREAQAAGAGAPVSVPPVAASIKRARGPAPAPAAAPDFPRYRIVRLDSLVPNPRNARLHTPESVDELVRQITTTGWTNPILVAGKDILAGHRRREAALKLGMAQVPVIDLSHLDEDQRRAYIIWDNQSAISGSSWDLDMLRLELAELRDDGFDLGFTGFAGGELSTLFKAAADPEPEEDIDVKVCCPECGHEFPTVAKGFRAIVRKSVANAV